MVEAAIVLGLVAAAGAGVLGVRSMLVLEDDVSAARPPVDDEGERARDRRRLEYEREKERREEEECGTPVSMINADGDERQVCTYAVRHWQGQGWIVRPIDAGR
jgi:hypothetical protein